MHSNKRKQWNKKEKKNAVVCGNLCNSRTVWNPHRMDGDNVYDTRKHAH